MTNRYEYIHCPVQWIGTLPKHWSLKRVKDIALLQSGDAITSLSINQEDEFPVFGGNGLRGYTDSYNHDGSYILIGRQGALCGNINYAHGKFFASEHAVVVYPHFPTNIFWFGELLREMNLNQYSNAAAQPGLAVEKIKNLKIPVPPRIEQTAIANYLNKACADIDKVIELKEEQFMKTEKLFFSFLDEMFKGEHTIFWVEERLKDITKINPSVEEDLINDTLVTVVPMECVSEMGNLDASEVVPFKDAVSGLNYFRNGDVLFAKITPCMENGKGAFVENLTTDLAFGSTEFFVVRPSKKILGKFIYYYTRAERYRLEAEANMKGAAGQQRVTPRFFNSSVIRYPKTIKEQEGVIAKIDAFRKRNENLLQLLRNQINTLLEYRNSLIHEVVTGKKQIYFEGEKNKSSKTKHELTAVA